MQALLILSKNNMQKPLLLAGLLLSLALPALAAPYLPYITLSGGQLVTKPGQDQTVNFSPEYWKTLVANRHVRFPLFGGISLGAQAQISNRWEAAVGLGYYQAQDIKLNGEVLQYSSPEFYNLNYEYHIQPKRVMLEGKWSTVFNTVYHPYFAAGIGISRNHSTGYEETSLQTYAVPDLPFMDATSTGFAYNLGLGLDVDVDPNCRIGIGLQFADWGTAELGLSPAEVTNERVNAGHLTSSLFVLQATYFLNI